MGYREDNAGYITSSKLNDFRTCPYFYKLKWIDNVVPEDESDALKVGAAFDLYMRDKEEFSTKYEIVARRSSDGDGTIIQLTKGQGDTIRQCELEFQRQPLYNPQGEMQFAIETLYRGHKVKGTLDEFQKDKKLIIDDKTTASMDTFRKFANKYKMQMTFYNWLLEVKHNIEGCNAFIRVVTKETPSRSEFFWIPANSLLQNRDFLLDSLNEMIDAIDANKFNFTPEKRNCYECPAWNICPNTIQTEADIKIL